MTNPTPHGQVPEALTHERDRAIMEGERNASLDAYSRVVLLTSAESRLYEAAFTNGWDRCAAHVQNPAEIEHVAGDVSKNGAELNISSLAHELFALAQLVPGEGIEDAVARISATLLTQQPAPAGAKEGGPPGSGGWEKHAIEMERQRDYYRRRCDTMHEHQSGDVWYWQGDGDDNLQSMGNSMLVVIRADQLRTLASPTAQPAPATQQAGATKEHLRLVRVIADKIEDGTLFQSGIYSNKDLARFVRNVADAATPQPSPAAQAAPAALLHLVHDAFAEIAMAHPKAYALHKVEIADTAVREALAAPAAGAVAGPDDLSETTTEDLMVIAVVGLNSARFRLGKGDCAGALEVVNKARDACIEAGKRASNAAVPTPAAQAAESVPEGFVAVPVEVANLYDFMHTAFVPMTPQQEQIAISLELARKACGGKFIAAAAQQGGPT